MSVQIVNESGLNNLIGSLYSSDSTAAGTTDVPLVDSGPVNRSTGSYPWRLDGDYTTLVSITNTLAQSTKYLATIKYNGGTYSLNPKDLAAGETTLFDLRKIRDEHIPDKDGSLIPRSITGGQFSWSLIGVDSLRLIGRAEVISPSKRVRSSFSCPVCCPDSFVGLEVTPASSSGPVGGTAFLAVDGFFVDCYNNGSGPFDWTASWSVEHESVISISMVTDGLAEMSCLAAGTSDFTAAYFGTWYSNDGMDCYSNNQNFFDDGDTVVRPLISVSQTAFSPTSIKVFPNTPNTTTAGVDISASEQTEFEGSLMNGDFVVVEILTQTSGGNFEIKVGAQVQTTQTIPLNLGNVVSANFDIKALNGTAVKNYSFTIRVADVRRPNPAPQPGSTSILTTVQLLPAGTGGTAGMLGVTN